MTYTCRRCNNELGSRIEAALLDWYDDAIRAVWVGGEGIPGMRRTSRLLRRVAEDGACYLIFEGAMDPGAAHVLAHNAEFEMRLHPPSGDVVRLAALKSAYLGACLLLRHIPDTPRAMAIRDELVEARDAPRKGHLPIGPVAKSTKAFKTGMRPLGTSVALVEWQQAFGGSGTHIVLAGTVTTAWPLEEHLVADII